MPSERRFYRFVDLYDDQSLIVQFEADGWADAHAEFLRQTGYEVNDCPRVGMRSYDLNGSAHKELIGITDAPAVAVWSPQT